MPIERIFHRAWLGPAPIPPKFEGFWQRLQEIHPRWEFHTWTDRSDLSFVRNRKLMAAMPTYSGKSDVLRIELLMRFGGVWVDCDIEPLRPFDPLLQDTEAFAAWEDGHNIAWGVWGARRGHPAVRELRRRLPQWAREHAREPANVRSGPIFLTSVWKDRKDVRIYPAVSFYPVPYRRRRNIKGPYPREAYAVHHWAESWKQAPELDGKREPLVVILVPHRIADPDRERAWKIARPHLEASGWPLITGDSVGEWNRSAACNAAARAAGDWDVAVVADADTVQEWGPVEDAVRWAHARSGAVVPWSTRYLLNAAGTRHLGLHGPQEPPPESGIVERQVGPRHGGATLVISRAAWEKVGGFDEGFTGYGFEDVAQRLALKALGAFRRTHGVVWHLWHEPVETEAQVCIDRYALYRHAARRGPGAVGRLLRELGVVKEVPSTWEGRNDAGPSGSTVEGGHRGRRAGGRR